MLVNSSLSATGLTQVCGWVQGSRGGGSRAQGAAEWDGDTDTKEAAYGRMQVLLAQSNGLPALESDVDRPSPTAGT